MAITHKFVSTKSDGGDATIVRPSNWNAEHTIEDGTFVRTATLVVAANDASAACKAQADYVCDGTADNVEIQAAIGALTVGRTIKEKIVLIGSFNSAAEIAVASYTIIKIQGSITISGTDTKVFALTPNHDIEISGGMIDGGGIAVGIHGETDVYNIRIIGVTIQNAAILMQGIFFKGHNIEILHNSVSGGGTGILVGAPDNLSFTSWNNRIIGNYVYNTTDDGIAIDNGRYTIVADNVINKNDIGVINSAGIKLYGHCFYTIVANNSVYNLNGENEMRGISLEVNTLHYCPNFCTVINNTVYFISGNGIFLGGDSGDADKRPQQINIIGNIVYDTNKLSLADTADIRLYYTDNILIQSNRFTTFSSSGDTNTQLRNNQGYITENSGTATVLNTTTSIKVAHGLAAAPTRVEITPTLLSAVTHWWVSSKDSDADSLKFTITVDQDPGAGTAIFDWHAQVGEG